MNTFEFNFKMLQDLIIAAQEIMHSHGLQQNKYWLDFIQATMKLQQNIYPSMGIMIIPGLGDLQQLESHSGSVPQRQDAVVGLDKLQPHHDLCSEH